MEEAMAFRPHSYLAFCSDGVGKATSVRLTASSLLAADAVCACALSRQGCGSPGHPLFKREAKYLPTRYIYNIYYLPEAADSIRQLCPRATARES